MIFLEIYLFFYANYCDGVNNSRANFNEEYDKWSQLNISGFKDNFLNINKTTVFV